MRAARVPARSRGPDPASPGGTDLDGRSERILQLQRQAGNRAVAQLLGPAPARAVQRAPRPESPPVTTLTPSGTMTEQQWTTAYNAAKAKPTPAAYGALFRDIALTAGMDKIPGFDLSSVPVSDGKTAKPGLNMTLAPAETGHTAWIDKSGKWGVKLDPSRTRAPDVAVGIILGPLALDPDKGLSLRIVRHEMVHAWHKVKVLEAVRAWQAAPGKAGLDAWLAGQVAKKTMTGLDLALVKKGAREGAANTEVLGYVEGFTNDFHRRAATMEAAAWSFFELLGVVETQKVYPWAESDQAVKDEALARLRDYRTRLGPDHRRLWKQWLDRERAKVVKGQRGRTEFLTALSAFVV